MALIAAASGQSLMPSNETIQQINSLTMQYRQLRWQGHYEEAIAPATQAIAMIESQLPTDQPDLATALTELAEIYLEAGYFAKADPLLQRALAIREKLSGPAYSDTAVTLNDLAGLNRMFGSMSTAEQFYRRAIAVREATVGPEHPETAKVRNNLAALLRDLGRYPEAEQLFLHAIEIDKKTLPPLHPDTATAYYNLAILYRQTGAYASAESNFKQALEIRKKIFSSEHPDTAAVRDALGELYLATHSYSLAKPILEEALAIRERTLGPNNPDNATSLYNLARLYQSNHEYTKAATYYESALAVMHRSFDPNHPSVAAVTDGLATVYRDTGSYAMAEKLYLQTLESDKKSLGAQHPDVAVTLDNLAILYHATGNESKSVASFEKAQVIEESNTARWLLFGSDARKLNYLQERAAVVQANVTFSLSRPTAPGIALALSGVLQYKGRALDATANSIARLRQDTSPQDSALLDQLSGVTQELLTLAFRPTVSLAEDYRSRVNALTQKQDQLEAQLSSRSASFANAISPITLENVRKALPDDKVLVEWFRYIPLDMKAAPGAPRYAAFVLEHRGEPVAVDLGTAESIDALVGQFRDALSNPANAYYRQEGRELFEILIKPLSRYLPRGARLLLSPDGALNLLPFAALVDEHDQYLVQSFELSYLTSGRDLLRIATRSPSRSSAVVVADPNYDLGHSDSSQSVPSDLKFAPLAGGIAEAKDIRALLSLSDSNVLTGDNATEARLRLLHGPRILHIATHGFFLDNLPATTRDTRPEFGLNFLPPGPNENPLLRSGLALAGANSRHSSGTDDGILTAAEVAQLDLQGTQLVVLSACETGVGTVDTSEGVYGLRRALVLAGAQSQLVSLWRTPDASTRELMVDYYRRLLKGDGRSAALREVQQAMINSSTRRHPYYWATFVLIGDWKPLASDN